MNSVRSARLNPIWVLVVTLILAVFVAGQISQTRTAPTGMVAAFVDTNGNDIDDTCEDPATVVADETAAADAEKAVDLDGDGTISVSEAAQSDRIGGVNCNHGGYVSWVARGSCPDAVQEPAPALVTGPALDAAATTTCEEAATTADRASKAAKDAEKAEKKAAREAAKAARKAAHDAAKAGRDGAKATARAERDAAKAERKAAREAAKAAKQQGKGKSNN